MGGKLKFFLNEIFYFEDIIVRQNATLKDLKLAIKKYILLKNSRENNTTIISWKYIWRKYCLCFENERLTDDCKLLKNYGIFNKSELKFIKKHSKVN